MAAFRLMGNETTWIAGGLFSILCLVVLSAQGVRPDSKVVFLAEIAFPLLFAPLLAPLALVDKDYGMAEMLNATPTPSAVRIGGRLGQGLAAPLLLSVPLAGLLCVIAGYQPPPGFRLMTGVSAAALAVFAGGLSFVSATLTGSGTVGYVAAPALVVVVMTLKGSLPGGWQPFPMAASLGRSLAMFAADPIASGGLFWLNRLGYALAGAVLVAVGLAYLEMSRWGY